MTAVAKKVEHPGALRLYKSYSFVDKDPVIDRMRTLIQDEGVSYADVEEDSGVKASTLSGWFTGPVRRPQWCTVLAVVRGLGYDIQIVKRHAGASAGIRGPTRLRVVGGKR